MEIKAKCRYDYETCKAVAHIDAYRKSNPKMTVISRAIFCLALTVLNLAVANWGELYTGYTVAIAAALLVLIDMFMYFGMPRLQYNSMSKLKDVENSYIFYDDEFFAETVSESFNGQDVIKYSLLEKAFETDRYFFIYINKRQTFVVDKASVEGGTAEEIKAKLTCVLGKKYIRCKY